MAAVGITSTLTLHLHVLKENNSATKGQGLVGTDTKRGILVMYTI